MARRFGVTRDPVSTAAALTDGFHIHLYRFEPVTSDRRHPGGSRPERAAIGRNLGIFRPGPGLARFDCPRPHGTVLNVCSHGHFFLLPPAFSRVIRHCSRRNRAEDPKFKRKQFNENSFMSALQALIYLAKCSAATTGPVGNEMPSARATATYANVMYLIIMWCT